MFDETLEKKDLFLLASRLKEKVNDPRNAKEHHESFLRKKNKKSVKQSAIFTYRPNTFQNPNFVDIKLDITEHPKTSQKLSNTIRKGEKVDSNSTLYSDPKKSQIFWTEKM